jgi:hypothetical protein
MGFIFDTDVPPRGGRSARYLVRPCSTTRSPPSGRARELLVALAWGKATSRPETEWAQHRRRSSGQMTVILHASD